MTKIVEIECCEVCPHYDNEYCAFARECGLLNDREIKNQMAVQHKAY